MNGKTAKLMRKVNKLSRKDKRLYNQLDHKNRGVLKQFYRAVIEANKEQQ